MALKFEVGSPVIMHTATSLGSGRWGKRTTVRKLYKNGNFALDLSLDDAYYSQQWKPEVANPEWASATGSSRYRLSVALLTPELEAHIVTQQAERKLMQTGIDLQNRFGKMHPRAFGKYAEQCETLLKLMCED